MTKPATPRDPTPGSSDVGQPTALELGHQPQLTPALMNYFAKCMEKLGFVPNVLRAYAFNAVKLQAFIDMVDDLMLADSGLSKAEREMIAVAVSAVNHCHYCLTAHGAVLRQRTKDPVLSETIAQNWRAADLTAKQMAMLEFAVKLTGNRCAVPTCPCWPVSTMIVRYARRS